MKKKVSKGEFCYLSQKKKQEIAKTILLFGISLAIFLIGFWSTKTKANLLTIVAVLGCLPASKSAVSMIMHLKQKGCCPETKTLLEKELGKEQGVYNLYFTSYDKNFDISHLFVRGMNVAALTDNHKLSEKEFESHIKTMLEHDGINGVTVKLFTDSHKYIQRVQQLLTLDAQKEKEERILRTLYSVSL